MTTNHHVSFIKIKTAFIFLGKTSLIPNPDQLSLLYTLVEPCFFLQGTVSHL